MIGYWAAISDWLSGVYSKIFLLAMIALSAAFLVLVLGTQSMLNVENGSMVLMVASMISLLFFMGGYFYISLNPSQPKSIPLYLAICMTGNLLYIPILIKDGNWPIFWLQAFCFSEGMIKLLAIYFALYLMSKKNHSCIGNNIN